MAPKYAKDQPAGFTNRIEKVAIVGVSLRPSQELSILKLMQQNRSLAKLAGICLPHSHQLASTSLLL
jgi:hypothetical protein